MHIKVYLAAININDWIMRDVESGANGEPVGESKKVLR